MLSLDKDETTMVFSNSTLKRTKTNVIGMDVDVVTAAG